VKKTKWFIKVTKIFPVLNLLKFLSTLNNINEQEKIQLHCYATWVFQLLNTYQRFETLSRVEFKRNIIKYSQHRLCMKKILKDNVK
jgi:hypothetical protein